MTVMNVEKELVKLESMVPALKNKHNEMDEILEGTALYISQLQRQLAAKLRTHGSGVGTGSGRHQSPHLAANINTNTASVDEIIKSISLTIATKGLNIKKK
eukprot:TRINITY_DN79438_c0_g1_i1.p1 TRINITY_DN79438_c0_g1~~TRINITY_DN79438_c0_g1_i1.p1  ORF type:complete len:101 (-),score=28.17 TRINITY_DN79438_c0_g1_i1:39-341(-)